MWECEKVLLQKPEDFYGMWDVKKLSGWQEKCSCIDGRQSIFGNAIFENS
jgi:hypothetical protein